MSDPNSGDRPLPRIDFEFATNAEERGLVWDSRFEELAFSPMEKGEDGAWRTLPTESIRILLQVNPCSAHLDGNHPGKSSLRSQLHDYYALRNALNEFIWKRFGAFERGVTLGAMSMRHVSVCRVEPLEKVMRNNRSWHDSPTDVKGQMTFERIYRDGEEARR